MPGVTTKANFVSLQGFVVSPCFTKVNFALYPSVFLTLLGVYILLSFLLFFCEIYSVMVLTETVLHIVCLIISCSDAVMS